MITGVSQASQYCVCTPKGENVQEGFVPFKLLQLLGATPRAPPRLCPWTPLGTPSPRPPSVLRPQPLTAGDATEYSSRRVFIYYYN